MSFLKCACMQGMTIAVDEAILIDSIDEVGNSILFLFIFYHEPSELIKII